MMTNIPKSHVVHHIQTILPRIKIYHKLDTLLTNLLNIKDEQMHSMIVIGIENEDRKRHFMSVSLEQLAILLDLLNPNERTLYELLCQKNLCKLYFDIDVYIDDYSNFDIKKSLLILRNLFHYIIQKSTDQSPCSSTTIEDHFLVLSASTENKLSYHLIYTNTAIRFDSQQSVGKFITCVLHHCARLVKNMPCFALIIFYRLRHSHSVRLEMFPQTFFFYSQYTFFLGYIR